MGNSRQVFRIVLKSPFSRAGDLRDVEVAGAGITPFLSPVSRFLLNVLRDVLRTVASSTPDGPPVDFYNVAGVIGGLKP